MSTKSPVYLRFADGASRHIQNLASTTWVIYSPEGLFVSSGGIFLGPSTNNVAKYSNFIELLHHAISHAICTLEFHLDSQLVVR
jgi:ribonuclease HI